MIDQSQQPATVHALAEDLLTGNAFWADDRCPLKAHLHGGDPQAMLVTGDNASGKSLLVEYLRTWAKHCHGYTQMSLSIRERTGSGLSEMANMHKAMIFGNEGEQSTGATSLSTARRAFETLKGWAVDRPGAPILAVLDEPELGLSSSYAPAMGTFLARSLTELQVPEVQLVVVTHHQGLAKAFAAERGQDPAFVRMDDSMNFRQWLEDKREHSLESLLAIEEKGSRQRKLVWDLEAALKRELSEPQEKEEPHGKRPRPGR